ncbi:alpha/beta hydrolase-fold protein [Sinomicrobium sp. M5D2P17]
MALSGKIYITILFLILWSKVLHAQLNRIPVNNDEAFLINSQELEEDRSIWVHLPSGYNSTNQIYPVLYLLDGEGHFKSVSDLVDYLSGYDRNRIPEIIVVAIPNVERGRDLTPVHLIKGRENNLRSDDNGAHKFLQFIQNELVSYIEANYRTAPYRILAGHSLAGFFGLYTKLASPDLFNSTILMSPAIDIDGGNTKIIDDFRLFLKTYKNLSDNFFISIGNENTQAVDAMVSQLAMFAPESVDWDFKKYEEENHFSVTYKSMYDALKFIYKDWFIDNYGTITMSYEEIQQHFDKLSKEFGYTMIPEEDFMNNFGYRQLRSNNIDEAIKIFKQNVENYPDSWNVYDSMGEAYMKKGERQLAIENYEKSVDLNADNQAGRKALNKLKNGGK